jgi:hypothetical protein
MRLTFARDLVERDRNVGPDRLNPRENDQCTREIISEGDDLTRSTRKQKENARSRGIHSRIFPKGTIMSMSHEYLLRITVHAHSTVANF